MFGRKKDDDTNIKCGTTGIVRVSNDLFWTRYRIAKIVSKIVTRAETDTETEYERAATMYTSFGLRSSSGNRYGFRLKTIFVFVIFQPRRTDVRMSCVSANALALTFSSRTVRPPALASFTSKSFFTSRNSHDGISGAKGKSVAAQTTGNGIASAHWYERRVCASVRKTSYACVWARPYGTCGCRSHASETQK